jgi:hypothetical protein
MNNDPAIRVTLSHLLDLALRNTLRLHALAL